MSSNLGAKGSCFLTFEACTNDCNLVFNYFVAPEILRASVLLPVLFLKIIGHHVSQENP